jgi:hypothetical protein
MTQLFSISVNREGKKKAESVGLSAFLRIFAAK